MKRQANASDPSAPAAKKTARTPAARKTTSAAKKTAAPAAKEISAATTAQKLPRRAPSPRGAAKPAAASLRPAIAAAAQRASDALPADALPPAIDRPREQMVRERAYAFYLARGCSDGYDVEDWLRAEAEVAAALASDQAP
jgi:hypothetical protein